MQHRIERVLGDLDDKISVNNSINAELQGMAKLLFNYWFVQFDFPMSPSQAQAIGQPGLVGKPYHSSGGRMVYIESLNREIPVDWTFCCLGDICKNIRDTVDPASVEPGTPYVGLEHVPRRKFFLDDWCVSESVTSLKSRFNVGDILFGKLRPYFHKVVKAPIQGICTSELLVVRPKNHLYEALVGSVLFSDSFVESTSKQWGGAQMPRADWKRMEKFALPLPTEELLSEFNSHVLPLWKFGGENQKQNMELSRLRDWLLPMLMSGQVTVG
jgi:type I restriction enzyme S subunit